MVRYLLNDACMILGKPFVHAAVYAWEGEVATFTGKPCYRCYIPKAPEESGRAIVGLQQAPSVVCRQQR